MRDISRTWRDQGRLVGGVVEGVDTDWPALTPLGRFFLVWLPMLLVAGASGLLVVAFWPR